MVHSVLLFLLWFKITCSSSFPSGTASPTFQPTFQPNFEDKPPPCISNETQLAYINGMISSSQTLYNCIENIADPLGIPTIYNGTQNDVMYVNTSLELNNLEEVG